MNRSLIDLIELIEKLPTTTAGCKEIICGARYPILMVDGRLRKVSRLVLELKLGREIRPKYMALHTCDNKKCVNSDHLYEGTHADNMRDASVRLRMPRGVNHPSRMHPENLARGDLHYTRTQPERCVRGEKQGNAVLTASDVLRMRELHRAGTRQCDLVRMFGVHQATVWGVTNYKAWRHLP